jgi:hypothetical protein
MNKKTSTLSEFIQTLILFVGCLWLYILYEGPEIWKLDFANYYRNPDTATLSEYVYYCFMPTFQAFFFVWPFTAGCGLQLLVMFFHLLKDGIVVHYRTSRIAIILGLYIVGVAFVSPLIYMFFGGDPWGCVFCLNATFMMIYGTIVGSQQLLRPIWAAAEAGNPAYKDWMAKGGDPMDSWPFFNPDSQAVRVGGLPEPKSSFVPPSDWRYQCKKCGARNERPTTCWFCHSTLSVVTPPGKPVTPPRMFTCYKCNRFVQEDKFGDFEKGVRCPFCNTKNYAPK